jgi:mannose-1-phosphate guanylyltransferase
LSDRAGGGSAFFIVNGDTLTTVDLSALARAHQESRALVTMAVVPNTQPDKYGGIVARGDSFLAITRGSSEPSYHFIGVQVAEHAAFASVPDGVPYESVRTLYPALMAAHPDSIRLFECSSEFYDIGTPADYLATSVLLASRGTGDLTPGAGGRIDPSARIEQSILWDDVVVEAGAMLRECVVTDGVRVPADTSWHGVSLRVAAGDLAPDERRFDELAIAPLDSI